VSVVSQAAPPPPPPVAEGLDTSLPMKRQFVPPPSPTGPMPRKEMPPMVQFPAQAPLLAVKSVERRPLTGVLPEVGPICTVAPGQASSASGCAEVPLHHSLRKVTAAFHDWPSSAVWLT